MMRLLLILVGSCSLLSVQSADFDSSHETLMQTPADHPCDPAALRELEQIGHQWLNVPSKQADDLAIWELINRCTPHNPDVLFYLGVQLSRAKRWSEAEAALKECLSLAPQYADADVQLRDSNFWANGLTVHCSTTELTRNKNDPLIFFKFLKFSHNVPPEGEKPYQNRHINSKDLLR